MVIILIVDVWNQAWGHGDYLVWMSGIKPGVMVIILIVDIRNQAWGHGDHDCGG